MLYFFGIYFNIIIISIVKHIGKSEIQKLKNLNDSLVLLLCAFNINFIEKIFLFSVADYIHLESFQLYINVSDIVLILCVLYITYLNMKLFIFNSSYHDKRSILGLTIPFQRKLSRYVFLWSFLIQLPWVIILQGYSLGGEGINKLAISIILGLVFSSLNSLFLVILTLNLNHSSIGVLYAINRSLDNANSLSDLKLEAREFDEHQDLLKEINVKIKNTR